MTCVWSNRVSPAGGRLQAAPSGWVVGPVPGPPGAPAPPPGGGGEFEDGGEEDGGEDGDEPGEAVEEGAVSGVENVN